MLKIMPQKKYNWKCLITDNLIVMQDTAPCWFHRKMQKWFFGLEWVKLPHTLDKKQTLNYERPK